MNNDLIKEARELLDKLWLQLDRHQETLDYGTPIFWNIEDKKAIIAEFMNKV